MNCKQTVERVAVLTSWKDIAQYMGKGVRTVQRWEQLSGLPVRRPTGFDKKAILARPGDLDAWIALRRFGRIESVKARSVSGGVPGGIDRAKASHTRESVLINRSTLASAMETSRLLLERNRALQNVLQSALITLQENISNLNKAA